MWINAFSNPFCSTVDLPTASNNVSGGGRMHEFYLEDVSPPGGRGFLAPTQGTGLAFLPGFRRAGSAIRQGLGWGVRCREASAHVALGEFACPGLWASWPTHLLHVHSRARGSPAPFLCCSVCSRPGLLALAFWWMLIRLDYLQCARPRTEVLSEWGGNRLRGLGHCHRLRSCLVVELRPRPSLCDHGPPWEAGASLSPREHPSLILPKAKPDFWTRVHSWRWARK